MPRGSCPSPFKIHLTLVACSGKKRGLPNLTKVKNKECHGELVRVTVNKQKNRKVRKTVYKIHVNDTGTLTKGYGECKRRRSNKITLRNSKRISGRDGTIGKEMIEPQSERSEETFLELKRGREKNKRKSKITKVRN